MMNYRDVSSVLQEAVDSNGFVFEIYKKAHGAQIITLDCEGNVIEGVDVLTADIKDGTPAIEIAKNLAEGLSEDYHFSINENR